jgi:sec-independent protein translocase protein TatC
MPQAFPAMLGFAESSTMEAQLQLEAQVSLVMALLLGFGVVFEIPVIIAFLSMIGLVDHKFLARYRRHAVVANFGLAAILTPTGDPINLLIMAVPMIAFYEVGIVLARVLGKKKPAPAV